MSGVGASPVYLFADDTKLYRRVTTLEDHIALHDDIASLGWSNEICLSIQSEILWFSVGIYAGVYIDQHYQMPNVDEPKEIVNKLREFMEQYKKDKPGPSKGS